MTPGLLQEITERLPGRVWPTMAEVKHVVV